MPEPTKPITKKKNTIKRITEPAVLRAKAADLHDQRCLIENCSSKRAIKVAHALDRGSAAYDKRALALEWSWNMRKNTLNLDTRQNIFFVGASVLQLYLEKKWALLPEDNVIYKYFDESRTVVLPRDRFPVVQPGESFSYKLIPIQGMEEVYLTRQTDLPTGGRTVDIYHPPFDDFPTLTSHLDPKFVIYRLGSVLAYGVDSKIDKTLKDKYPILREISVLYSSWLKDAPENAAQDPTYVLPISPDEYDDDWDVSEQSSDGDSTCTPPRRIRSWMNAGEPVPALNISPENKASVDAAVSVPEAPKSPVVPTAPTGVSAMLPVMEPTSVEPAVIPPTAQQIDPPAAIVEELATPPVPNTSVVSVNASIVKTAAANSPPSNQMSHPAASVTSVPHSLVAPAPAPVPVPIIAPPPRRFQPIRGAKNPKKRATEDEPADDPHDKSSKRQKAVTSEAVPEKVEQEIGKAKKTSKRKPKDITNKVKNGDNAVASSSKPLVPVFPPVKKPGRPRKKKA